MHFSPGNVLSRFRSPKLSATNTGQWVILIYSRKDHPIKHANIISSVRYFAAVEHTIRQGDSCDMRRADRKWSESWGTCGDQYLNCNKYQFADGLMGIEGCRSGAETWRSIAESQWQNPSQWTMNHAYTSFTKWLVFHLLNRGPNVCYSGRNYVQFYRKPSYPRCYLVCLTTTCHSADIVRLDTAC